MNATLNASSAALLLSGLVAIRSGRRALHARLMLAACVSSTLFLASYLVYHFNVGSVRFSGESEVVMLRILRRPSPGPNGAMNSVSWLATVFTV